MTKFDGAPLPVCLYGGKFVHYPLSSCWPAPPSRMVRSNAEDIVAPHLRDGSLLQVLDDWTPHFAGYHLYYPSRRQNSAAFSVILDALRYRE